MDTTSRALCTLAAWARGMAIPGGMAHADRLVQARLDFSPASLARIDAMLDELHDSLPPEVLVDGQARVRAQLLADPASRNFLELLGFYLGEFRARQMGTPARWMSWAEARDSRSGLASFGAGIHSLVIQVHPGVHLPLLRIAQRLIEGRRNVSVADGIPVDLSSELPLPGWAPSTMIGDLPARFGRLPSPIRAMFRPQGFCRALGPDGEGAPLDSSDHELLSTARSALPGLVRASRIVWAALVRADDALFVPGREDAFGELVIDPRGRLSREALVELASLLFARHVEPGADNEVAPEICAWPLRHVRVVFARESIPMQMLAQRCFPVMIDDGSPDVAVLAPWPFWPPDLLRSWCDEVAREYPAVARPSLEMPALAEFTTRERLQAVRWYDEGLELWRDGRGHQRRAIALWEQAASRLHHRALQTLALVYLHGLGVAQNPQAFERCSVLAQRVAEERVGLVAAALELMREDCIDAAAFDGRALELLELAALLGEEGAKPLLRRVRERCSDRRSEAAPAGAR